MTKLETEFETRVREQVKVGIAAKFPYPSKFIQMLKDEGVVGACKHLFANGVRDGGYPRHEGFTRAVLADRPDLTVEWLVWAEPKWHRLFPEYIRYLKTLARNLKW